MFFITTWLGSLSAGGAPRPPAASAFSCSFLSFSCAMIFTPAGNEAAPLTWSPSLCVSMSVVTGFGVTLAISASSCLPPSAVTFASTTMTPLFPTMMPLLPPPPETQ